jgi:hypothetical protein
MPIESSNSVIRVERSFLNPNTPGDTPGANLGQEPMLLIHVGSPKERASEHQLPMDRQTLALEWDDVERVGIVDQCKRALGRQGVHDGGKMLCLA